MQFKLQDTFFVYFWALKAGKIIYLEKLIGIIKRQSRSKPLPTTSSNGLEMCHRKIQNILVPSQNKFLPSEETNCPMALDPPRLFSWNWTSETMMLSSSTDPQPIQTASPRAWSMSISLPPQFEQTCDIIPITLIVSFDKTFQMKAVIRQERENEQKTIATLWSEYVHKFPRPRGTDRKAGELWEGELKSM